MGSVLFWILLITGIALLTTVLVSRRRASTASERLLDRPVPTPDRGPGEAVAASRIQDRAWVPWVFSGVCLTLLWFLVGWNLLLACATSLVGGVLCWIVLDFLLMKQAVRYEMQLAEAIDLTISALRAGSGLSDALESTGQELRQPLRDAWDEMVSRLRLGDDPNQVFETLSQRVPLPGYRLFSFVLKTNWSVGGSIAGTFSSIARGIRDRVEVLRRVRTQSAEAQFSVIGVLAITYCLAFLMWTTNPEGVDRFFGSEFGRFVTSIVVGMQGIGLLWMVKLTRIPV